MGALRQRDPDGGMMGDRCESQAGKDQTDFTRALRRAVSNRVSETGWASLGQGMPFILTQNWREEEKGTRTSWILNFWFR